MKFNPSPKTLPRTKERWAKISKWSTPSLKPNTYGRIIYDHLKDLQQEVPYSRFKEVIIDNILNNPHQINRQLRRCLRERESSKAYEEEAIEYYQNKPGYEEFLANAIKDLDLAKSDIEVLTLELSKPLEKQNLQEIRVYSLPNFEPNLSMVVASMDASGMILRTRRGFYTINPEFKLEEHEK